MQIEDVYTSAVEKAAASTVSVRTSSGPMCSPYGHYPMRGIGSGVVFDKVGHVLTNQHVVLDAKHILVTLSNGRVAGGSVVGSDHETDIAVLKIDDEGLVPAEFGDSGTLKVGQPILAIGNPLGLSGGPTVTSGVVSSLHRSLHGSNGDGLQVIQTDAAINPGNSGGPLVDLQGRVVAIAAAQIPMAEGIGFAIPSNLAKETAMEIIEHGSVRRPWLGIVGYELNRRVAYFYGLSTSRGVFVTELAPGGPADSSGVHVGDILVSIAGKMVSGMEDLLSILRTKKIGESTELEVERHGQTKRIQLALGTRPV